LSDSALGKVNHYCVLPRVIDNHAFLTWLLACALWNSALEKVASQVYYTWWRHYRELHW